MTKSKTSILNAIMALIQMVSTSVIGLILGKSILEQFGSDINGINSTISQLVSTLMVLEGGLTLASNVALFEPFSRKDYMRISGIISATKNKFIIVGAITLVCSFMLSLIYPLSISLNVPNRYISALILTVALPVCYNLGITTKYRVLILAAQKEYVISFYTTIFYIIGNLLGILLINFGYDLLVARIVIMLSLICNYTMLQIYCRKKFTYINYNATALYSEIKGTRSVISLKVVSVLYTSAPVIVISTLPNNGLLLASVYSVYKSVISIVRNCLTSVCNAPRLSFGALLAEGNIPKVKKYFNMYERINCICLTVILGTTALLLLPFVELYTAGINDVEYRDIPLAILMIITTYVEIIHIPSGQIIQMKGDFAVSNKIQIFSSIALVGTMIWGRMFGGIMGITLSVFVAAVILAVLEITYVSKSVLKRKISSILLNILPCGGIIGVCIWVGMKGIIVCNNYISFMIQGMVYTGGLAIVTSVVYYYIDSESMKEIMQVVCNSIGRKIKSK